MKRLLSMGALALAFTLSYLATPRANEELHAQIGIPCTCSWLAGNTGSVYSTCLGTANMDSITCSQVGSLCQIAGTAIWTPRWPTSCVIGGSTNGWVRPISNATGSWRYFNPSAFAAVPWQITSSDCGGGTFGAAMDVVHRDWTVSGTTCTCVSNTSTQSRVAVKLWTCDTIL